MRKPIIGILGNTYKTQPGLFSSAERMYVNSDYIESVLNNGGIPMAIPAVAMKADPEGILAVCDGILVPGGEDLNPWYYGEEPKPQIQTIRPEIDAAWFALGRAAKEMGMPMLGICKGIQFLNVLCGGDLYRISIHRRKLQFCICSPWSGRICITMWKLKREPIWQKFSGREPMR